LLARSPADGKVEPRDFLTLADTGDEAGTVVKVIHDDEWDVRTPV
jgi:hypothetical protein